MTTTALPMTTSLIGDNSTANSTWPLDQGNITHRPYEMDPNEILDLQKRFIPIIVLSIPAHLSILIIILCNKSLRNQAFFMGVLSMTIFDLFHYMVVLPINFDHYINWGKWRHGNIVCIVYIVFLNSKLYVSALMILALCVERLMTKLRSVAVVGERTSSIVSKVCLVLPWCIGIVGGVLITLIKQDEMSRHRYLHEHYCVFMVEQTFHIPYLVIMYLIPLGLLVLVPIAMMMVVYKYKKSDWNRLSAETLEPAAVSLRMSTLCVWIVSIVYVVLCVPVTYCLTLLVLCVRRIAGCPTIQLYRDTHTVSLLLGFVTPFLWIITVEIRAALLSFKFRVINMVTPSEGQKTVLSFSSLQHKISSDDTGTGR
ncbi:uncharacterized protein LOC110451394 [Mizuhopecten yessoensis]|nr:uncharacterized protein LOC110451394 [Mizuhopecten yessoensis]